MKKSIFWRSLIVVIAICISLYVISTKGLNKGLDLAGGTHFTIGVLLKDISEDKKQEAVEQTLAVYRNRIDEIGVSGTTIQRSGEDKIIVQVPGINIAEAERIREILMRQARLEFRLVVDDPVNYNL